MNNTPRYSPAEYKPLDLSERILVIEGQQNKLQNDRNDLVLRKKEIENLLTDINLQFKTEGKMDDADYKKLLLRQANLKDEKYHIEVGLGKIKQEIRNLELERQNVKHKKDVSEPNGKVEAIALGLRDKYLAFAADTTRVASMRAMASKFVEELQEILKEVKAKYY